MSDSNFGTKEETANEVVLWMKHVERIEVKVHLK